MSDKTVVFNWIKILLNGEQNIESVNSTIGSNKIFLKFPCSEPSTCSPFKVFLSRGKYNFSLCGGSGGVNETYEVTSRKPKDTPYGGGCSSGVISINSETIFFIHIGGRGTYSVSTGFRSPGGYNGGGSGNQNDVYGCSGGGGSSDIRAEVDDVFHRIIVAGGGGGGDDLYGTQTALNNDGRGGSGGGVVAQGWYQSGSPVSFPVANDTFGFSFGHGESSSSNGSSHPNGSTYKIDSSLDVGGAGGGWYGGFASHHNGQGAGGGSSFALTINDIESSISNNLIEERDSEYVLLSAQKYAFMNCDKYCFYNVIHERGAWFGNGYAEITMLSSRYVNYLSKEYICNSINGLIIFLTPIVLK